MANHMERYNGKGLASVLEGAEDLIKRAAILYRKTEERLEPPEIKAAYQKEIDVCLIEAQKLISSVILAKGGS